MFSTLYMLNNHCYSVLEFHVGLTNEPVACLHGLAQSYGHELVFDIELRYHLHSTRVKFILF